MPQERIVSRKEPLALGERPVGRGHEENQIRAWNEVAGERLVLPGDGVRSRRIDDLDVLENRDGSRNDLQGVAPPLARLALAVPDEGDALGGGCDAFLEYGFPEQGIDERALSGVELSRHDEEEELVELTDRGVERGGVLGLDREPLESEPEIGETAALLGEKLLLRRTQDSTEAHEREVYPTRLPSGLLRARGTRSSQVSSDPV